MDDIIFGSNDDMLSKKFAIDMESEFEMSLLGELIYLLGLQISQQDKEYLFFKQNILSLKC